MKKNKIVLIIILLLLVFLVGLLFYSPENTEEIFLTDKGRFNAFGLIGLTW